MWELLHTEVSYIRKLRVITNVSVGPPDPCCFSRACTGRLRVREPSLSWALLAGFENRQVSQGEEGIPSSAWEGTSRLLVKPV